MKAYPNIEKSAFRRGQYVGYAKGVWTITKSSSSYGCWFAVHQEYPKFTIHTWTLDTMSRRLTEMEGQIVL
jgi:hypothetical protein